MLEKQSDERQRSLCAYGVYNGNLEKAFHNCFSRTDDIKFEGYIDEFKKKIELSFQTRMSWDNYGEWEVDHIIPLAKGGNHKIKNLQALWKSENRRKGCKNNINVT